MTPILCSKAKGRIEDSTSVARREYGGWSEAMGATCMARCICCALKFETPMWRIFPSALSFASAPTASSIDPGEALSGPPLQAGQWI
jgi:hypothetical protein